jgi:hypothetical protein
MGVAAHATAVARNRDEPRFGDDIVLIVDSSTTHDAVDPRRIVIGLDETGDCPLVDASQFDILITRRENAPAPWVSAPDTRLEAERLASLAAAHPIAARTLADVLRLQVDLDFHAAISIESLAYSTLLGAVDFAGWLAGRAEHLGEAASAAPIRVLREDNVLTLVLSDPKTRNAITAALRDAMFDFLTNAIDDPSLPDIAIIADGRCFSTGGYLPEFGSNRDLALAHIIRIERSCASLLHRLGDRATVTFHGAAIGSGLEIFAAARHRFARPGSWFQLPELAMGLIPGAGGTVTVMRAIGRHRACWLMLGGRRIDAKTAQQWGLVERIVA